MHSRPKSILGASVALVGIFTATGVLVASPASAAGPTFDTPELRVGWGNITLTGTATAGATVQLHERAYIWGRDVTRASDLEAATPWEYPTSATANSSGRWSITRTMDSGFVFAVESGGAYSPIVQAPLRVGAEFSATSSSANSVSLTVRASPDQPGIPVSFQRYTSSGWSQVAAGITSDGTVASFSATVTGQTAGQHTYRAVLAETAKPDYASSDNLLLSNSFSSRITVAGSGGSDGPTPGSSPTPTPSRTTTSPSPTPSRTTTSPSPTPSRTTSSPTPTPPKTTSPTPKPTTPKPTATPVPAVGAIQFTRIQYNAPGADKKTNKSINGEYFKLTNKTKKTVNLNGWTVRDRAGNTYKFSGTYNLAAGKSVTVHTGKGTNSSTKRYWGKAKHIWNNGGDAATLRTNANKTIDSCKWTKAGKGYTTC
ncbi:lamin tail domain-containing protein [Actinoplanes rectilineatus]|uniref:lamin tail domain-containing protein n=1 Tax=Actinoplanes rectilineatus TaxID=113571 RepID=UPI000AB9FC67|nr:lamin tail domain-containing protein [Actinoplanes rectilineatus]